MSIASGSRIQDTLPPDMSDQKPVAQLVDEAEKRFFAKVSKGTSLMGRVLVFGPPVTRKKKNAIEYMKGFYLEQTGHTIEQELFNLWCPEFFVFMWDPDKKDWIKAYLAKVI